MQKCLPVTLVAVVVVVSFLVNPFLRAQIPQVSGNLKSEIVTIGSNMPGSGSGGFVKPTSDILARWRTLIISLLDEQYLVADSLLQADFPFYQLSEYTDTGYQNHTYYLLREQLPVSRGWGTFIFNPGYQRETAIEIPHPKYDTNTHQEGIDVFRKTGSRFFMMSGTHRCANSEASSCDGTTSVCGTSGLYRVSDMAHFVDAVFQVCHEEAINRHPQLYAFNLHGHANSSCQDFFLSNGHATNSKPLLYDFKNSLIAAGGVTAAVAGDGTSTCPLIGSTNVQGRFSNGSPEPCTQAVSSTIGYFIHIEQSSYVRNNLSVYEKLINTINENIQAVTAIDVPGAEIPSEFQLISVYPNPFNPATTIEFTLTEPAFVTLKIYDALGREVETLVNSRLMEGIYRRYFIADQLSGGFYYARIRAGEHSQTVKLILLR
jgi:hypothetical protein